MNHKLEKLIAPAIEAVQLEMAQNNRVPSEYNGYISSLGAGLVQSGLLPTLAFYANINAKSKQDRTKLLQAIYRVESYPEKLPEKLKGDELLRKAIAVQGDATQSAMLKERIRTAAVAIKLAIRTFKLDKKVGSA